jgi:hypothetical protein
MKGFVFFIALFCLPIICLSQYNYYYGNIHSHTAYSDGNQDSIAANCFNPAQSYTYAKGSYHIDFWGISEHNHYSFANDLPKNQQIKNALSFKPKILESKTIIERIKEKIQEFINTFIKGMGTVFRL